MNLHTFRRLQKPMLFGLAVFLMAAFGFPWDQVFRTMRARNTGGTEVMRMSGRKVTQAEFNGFDQRWRTVLPDLARRYSGEQLVEQIRQQMRMVFEAERLGLTVSDAEVARQVAKSGQMRQYVTVEFLEANNTAFEGKAEVTDDEIQAYYDEHKDEFKKAAAEGEEPAFQELDAVRDEVKRKLAGKKAEADAATALAEAKAKAEADAAAVQKAFEKAAEPGKIERNAEVLVDDKRTIQQTLGALADNKDLSEKVFTAPLGVIYGPYEKDGRHYIFRVTGRTAGFDGKGKLITQSIGWTGTDFGILDTVNYERLVGQRLRQALTPAQFEQTLRETLLVSRYNEVVTAVAMPTDTVDQEYQKRYERLNAYYIGLQARDFEPSKQVTVTDQEIRDFYDKYKNLPAPKTGSGPGYKQPEMVSVEYVLAKKPSPEQANYSDAELRKFYDAHLKRYVRDEKAEQPEYKTFEEVKEAVVADLAENQFAQIDKKLQDVATAVERALDKAPDKEPQMALYAGRAGLMHKNTKLFRADGRDFYQAVGVEFARDQEAALQEFLNTEYITAEELAQGLRPSAESRERRIMLSHTCTLKSTGSKYVFRVLQRVPEKVLEFDQLPENVREQVKRDRRMQKALDIAQTEARKLLTLANAGALDKAAEDLGVEPVVTDQFDAGKLPSSVDAGSPIAKAASGLKPGELSGLIADGDSFHVVLCSGGAEKDAKLAWSILTFAKDQELRGPAPSDDELADYLVTNYENYAADLPLKGDISVDYIAAKYDELAKTITPTDDEINDYYTKNKDERFGGKELADCKADVEKALKTEMATAKAQELISKALDSAKADKDKRFDEIVKDTPLKQTYASVDLAKAADTEFIGKADDLARTLLATKKNELTEPIATAEGVFFLKVTYKTPGKAEELWKDLGDEAKEKVKTDLAAKQTDGTPARKAELQIGRYVRQAFTEAAETTFVVEESIDPSLQLAKRLSLQDTRDFTDETVKALLAAEPGTISEVADSKNGAAFLRVIERKPMQMAKVEYIKLLPTNFVKWDPNMDWETARKEGLAKAEAAGSKLHEAAVKSQSLKAAVQEVGKEYPGITITAQDSPFFSSSAANIAGLGYDLNLFDRIFKMKPGELSDVIAERDMVYLVRLLDIRPCTQAKVAYVRTFQTQFITGDVSAEDAPAKAEEAMKAYRAAAEAGESLESGLEDLKKAMASDVPVSVTNVEKALNLGADIPGLEGRAAVSKAIANLKAGEISDVIKDGGGYYVVQVIETSEPEVVTADVVSFSRYSFGDPAAVSKDQLQEHYDQNMEKYRRDDEIKADYLRAKNELFIEEVSKSATDDALKAYFEVTKARWQPPAQGEDPPPEVKFEDVKAQVRQAFVTETCTEKCIEALAAAKEEMTKEDADLQKLATDTKLEYQTLGFSSKKDLAMKQEARDIPGLPDELFALKKGEVTGIKTKGTEYYIFKVVDQKESWIPTLDEVKDKLRSDVDQALLAGRTREAAAAVKAEVEKAVGAGKKFDEAAKACPATFARHKAITLKTAESLARRSLNPYYGMYQNQGRYTGGTVPGLAGERPKFIETAFSLPEGKISQPVMEENEQQAVYLVMLRKAEELEKPTDQEFEYIQGTIENLARREQVETLQKEMVMQ